MDHQIKEGIHYVGSLDWDRRLFDELIPLPDGTTYNAYLIKDEKTALIDAVDPPMSGQLIKKLKKLGVIKLDYVIAQHAEQDHSGAIPEILCEYPEAKVVTNPKCAQILKTHLHIPDERLIIRQDQETLSLGKKTLKFIMAPWVHWPETMLTYLPEDKILFTCDLFGSHLAQSGLFAGNNPKVMESAKRYYAEIMMPFRKLIVGHLKKIGELDFDMIATSHGPVHDRPENIINAYRQWTSDEVGNEAVIAYVSMHGSTKIMADRLTQKLMENGIAVKKFNLTVADIGELAMSLVEAATLVIGTPTVLAGAHPKAVYAAYLAGILRPKTKNLALFGSYGWGGQTAEQLISLAKMPEANIIDPVLVKGLPTGEGLRAVDALADKILEKHSEQKLI
jgi:flavorubredoxin